MDLNPINNPFYSPFYLLAILFLLPSINQTIDTDWQKDKHRPVSQAKMDYLPRELDIFQNIYVSKTFLLGK